MIVQWLPVPMTDPMCRSSSAEACTTLAAGGVQQPAIKGYIYSHYPTKHKTTHKRNRSTHRTDNHQFDSGVSLVDDQGRCVSFSRASTEPHHEKSFVHIYLVRFAQNLQPLSQAHHLRGTIYLATDQYHQYVVKSR